MALVGEPIALEMSLIDEVSISMSTYWLPKVAWLSWVGDLLKFLAAIHLTSCYLWESLLLDCSKEF